MSGSEDGLFGEEPEDEPEQEAWRPVWEDEAAEADAAPVPPWMTPTQARTLRPRTPDATALLGSLAAAEDVLSRLDAGAEATSEPVREGLAARLAAAEASGWLASAADRVWVHPRDLALAEAGLLGNFSAAALGGRPARALPATSAVLGGPGRAGAALVAEVDRLPDGPVLAQGLALARALRRLAGTGWDPLASPEATATALAPLITEEHGVVRPRLHPERFQGWRRAALAGSGKEGATPDHPVLLAAAAAGAAWMEAGVLENARPTPAQALLLAAAVVRRRGRLRAVPLPFWGLGPLERPATLPLQDPATWPGVFLERVAAAARRALAELARLRDAEAVAARLADTGRRSLLPAAAEAALRAPVVTATSLAQKLSITPQGALLLLQRLSAGGVVREATGRRSFRAWVA